MAFLRSNKKRVEFDQEMAPEPKLDDVRDSERGCKEPEDRHAVFKEQGNRKQPMASRPLLMSALILLIGSVASAVILAFGITSATHDQQIIFETVSSDLFFEFDVALSDYLVAGQWVHQAFRTSRTGSQTHQDFHEVYENLISTGLEFHAVAFAMNVSSAERGALENETQAFIAESHPDLNYSGFLGFEAGSLGPRANSLFYFPAHFMEPMDHVGSAIDTDFYTSLTRRKAIDQALRTWKPAMTEPLSLGHYQLARDSVACLRSVFLFHPGTPLSSHPDVVPRDVSVMGINILDVIRRAQMKLPLHERSVSIYIFDSTDSIDDPPLLGGATLNANNDMENADDTHKNDGHSPQEQQEHAQHHAHDTGGVVLTPETKLSSLCDRKGHYHRFRQYPIASREWTFVVVASEDEFSAEVTFVILGAVMIFVACTCTALWVYTNYKRVAKMNELRSKVEAEKAAIMVESARKATLAERELNDFIAHEVRNPLSAAVSACSFVSCAVNETAPLVDAESRASVREDVSIIDTSLQFINDLLRNMLDMHRASSNQLSIEISPVDILSDVLQPVASMLYRRGNDFEVLLDCPPNLVVETDRLRLKQTILNLGRNAIKFVEKGFIRFRAGLVNGNVCLYVEDSGPGIPLEKRTKLFSKFQESLDSMNQGTGIGLCLCKNLVELMDGGIWLDESFDSGIEGCPGTRFVIDLKTPPVSIESITSTDTDLSTDTTETDSRSSVEEPDTLPQQELPKGLSVLFVDDDMILRKLFSRAVRKVTIDWCICEAANGETALRLVDDQQFDVIFLDQYMASVDRQLLGTETARALRAKGVESTICGLSANDLGKSFIQSGANTFMMKPFPCDKEALKTELLRVISSGEKKETTPTEYRE